MNKLKNRIMSRWFSSFLVLSIAISLLSGCGSSSKSADVNQEATTATVAAAGSSSAAASIAGRDDRTDYISTQDDNGSNIRGEAKPSSSANQSPNDTYFQDYGVNPFEDAKRQPLSTFSLDVDTASYTIARKYINEGSLPPKDAIRVEEFINYFKRDYPKPTKDVFSIYTEMAPSAFNRGYHILEVGLQGKDVGISEMKSTALTFVIDVSGSMDMDNRLGLVKKSLKILVDKMGKNDTIGIVVYGTNGRVLMGPTPGNNKSEILSAINELEPEGSTNAAEGLMIGYDMTDKAFIKGGNNRIILCTDGVANQGITRAEDILKMVEDYKARGITLTTLGFGMDNFNDIFLETLADKGDGNYSYIDTLDEAEKVFGDQLTGTLEVIAKDAKAQLEFDPAIVESYRLIGYENRALADKDFKNNSVDAGEIGAGHSVTALYEIKLRNSTNVDIGTVKLSYKDPQTKKVTEIDKNISATQIHSNFYDATPRFMFLSMVAQTAEILKGSPWSSNTSLKDVFDILINDISNLKQDEKDREFVDLVYKAMELKERN